MTVQPVEKTNFNDLSLLQRGKVRDIYDLADALLIVVTDRISAFDVVLPDPIPGKGMVLNLISKFWFDMMAPMVPNHVITCDVESYPDACRPYRDVLRDRSMLVKKAAPLPIECVVRGYISGSGWNDYQRSGTVCGIPLPPGMIESAKLDTPIFTPSTKADLGQHDENIDFDQAADRVGRQLAERVRDLSLAIYEKGRAYAETRGIIIADTKFEFGMVDGELTLIDEVMTPDSSRFWPMDTYAAGGAQKSYDKQYVRDYLLSLDWDKTPPGPSLPEKVIADTRAKYIEALNRLTGTPHAL